MVAHRIEIIHIAYRVYLENEQANNSLEWWYETKSTATDWEMVVTKPRFIASKSDLLCVETITVDINTELQNLYQISKKELIVLNPWLSGRGPFPGRTEITTSKPTTRMMMKILMKKWYLFIPTWQSIYCLKFLVGVTLKPEGGLRIHWTLKAQASIDNLCKDKQSNLLFFLC